QRAEGTEDGAVGRIVEERSQASLGSARRAGLRKTRPRRGELGAARVQERVERRDRGCRRIDVAPAVPVDFAVTTVLGKRPGCIAIVCRPQSSPVLIDGVLNRGNGWSGGLEHGRRNEGRARTLLCESRVRWPVAALSATNQGQSHPEYHNQLRRFHLIHDPSLLPSSRNNEYVCLLLHSNLHKLGTHWPLHNMMVRSSSHLTWHLIRSGGFCHSFGRSARSS